MNVACPGCGTRYAVSDDKVRGRRVRITCKHCSAPIIVDGTAPATEAALSSPPSPSDTDSKSTETASLNRPAVLEPSPPTPPEKKPSGPPLGVPPVASAAKPLPATRVIGAKSPLAPAVTTASTSLPKSTATPSTVTQPTPSVASVTTTETKSKTVQETPKPIATRLAETRGRLTGNESPSPAAHARQAEPKPPIAKPKPPIAEPKPPIAEPKPPIAEPKPVPAVATAPNVPIPRSMTPLAVPTVQRPAGRTPLPLNAVTSSPQGGTPPTRANRPQRAMHATIIGVAAPANPPPEPVAPPLPPLPSDKEAASELGSASNVEPPVDTGRGRPAVVHAVRRNPKQTIIGGLEAAPGSAPTPQAVGLGIPTEVKWTVLLASSGAEVMSAPDIVRAFVEGRIKHDAKLWREGLDGWKSLADIEPIRVAFQRAGLSLQATESAARTDHTAQAPTAPSRPPATGVPHVPATPPSFRPAVPTSHSQTSWDEEVETLVRRELQSEGAPSVSAAKFEDKRRSAPGVEPSPPVIEPPPPRAAFTSNDLGSVEPVPPISRPDIGPRDTVRGELQSVPSVPPNAPALPETPAPLTKDFPPTQPIPKAPSRPNVSSDDGVGTYTLTTTRPKIRRKKRRVLAWFVWLLVVAGLATLCGLSYRYKQPKALYSYLHQKHLDVPLDRQVQRLFVRPFRSLTKPFEHPSNSRK